MKPETINTINVAVESSIPSIISQIPLIMGAFALAGLTGYGIYKIYSYFYGNDANDNGIIDQGVESTEKIETIEQRLYQLEKQRELDFDALVDKINEVSYQNDLLRIKMKAMQHTNKEVLNSINEVNVNVESNNRYQEQILDHKINKFKEEVINIIEEQKIVKNLEGYSSEEYSIEEINAVPEDSNIIEMLTDQSTLEAVTNIVSSILN
jgi:hypothetical protein